MHSVTDSDSGRDSQLISYSSDQHKCSTQSQTWFLVVYFLWKQTWNVLKSLSCSSHVQHMELTTGEPATNQSESFLQKFGQLTVFMTVLQTLKHHFNHFTSLTKGFLSVSVKQQLFLTFSLVFEPARERKAVLSPWSSKVKLTGIL